MKKLLLKSLLLLCALMAGSGSAWAQSDYSATYTTSGISLTSSSVKVKIGENTYDAVKEGSSKTAGSWSVTVPSGTKYLHLHAAGWKGETVELSITPNTNISPSSISLTSDTNIAGTVTEYDVDDTKCTTDYYKVITFTTALTSNTKLTFKPSSGNRFVIWGVNTEEEETVKVPIIKADDVEMSFANSSGVINYSIENGTTDGVLTAALVEPSSWLTVGEVTSTSVAVNVAANDGAVRSAKVRLTYTYDTDKTATKDVTITQNSPLEEVWVETSLAKLAINDVIVIVGDNGSTYALPNNGGTSSAPAAVAVTVNNGKISSTVASKIQWTLKGSASGGYEFYSYAEPTKWLYCINNNNGVRVGTGIESTFEIKDGYIYNKGQKRYLGIYDSQDWRCYDNNKNNIKDQTFKFYKRTYVAKIALASACTDGEFYYGTYSNSSAFVVPSDLIVSEISVIDGELSVDDYKTGDIVPANTGVMVAAETAGDHEVTLSSEAGTSVLGEYNMLRPSAEAMTGDCKFYRLTMHNADAENGNGGTIGFWWGAEDGKAFTIAENKAYLAVPVEEEGEATGARTGFAFGHSATGIQQATNAKAEAAQAVYNMQGQRVTKAQKGLYIVNGKKMLVK